jgi:hypothetical protein
MKHHFGDMLDRSGGHWNFTPNAERFQYHCSNWHRGLENISVATLMDADENWEILKSFPNLLELTLHSPSTAQLEFVGQLWRLKRLRISHAQPKDLKFLNRLQNLEEVILEYVSGFDDVAPLGELKNLKALHIENLRRVRNFTHLKNASNLQYLSIDGTFDWAQPIENLDFLGDIHHLQFLRLKSIRSHTIKEPFAGLTKLQHLAKIDIAMNAFPLEVFAWLMAKLPHVKGAIRPAFVKFGGEDREINPLDLRFRMSVSEFESRSGLFIGREGKRYQRVPFQAVLLGKGTRSISGAEDKVDKACEAHALKFERMVAELS